MLDHHDNDIANNRVMDTERAVNCKASRIRKRVLFLISLLIITGTAFIVAYSFIKTPFGGDIRVFFAAADQVKYQPDSGVLAVFEAWELKGIGNRLLIYSIYQVACQFTAYGDVVSFQIISKAVYFCAGLIILLLASWLFPAKRKSDKALFFYASFFLVFANFFEVHLQAEMSVTLLALLSLSCMLHKKKPSLTLAGAIGASFLFFKSILIVFFFAVIVGAEFCRPGRLNKKDYALVISSFVCAEVILLATVAVIYPQEFADMAAASEYQSTLFSLGSSKSLASILDSFCSGIVKANVTIPFLFLGISSALYALMHCILHGEWKMFVLLVIVWIIPIDVIVVANNYFTYHFLLLVLPSLLSILFLMRTLHIKLLSIAVSFLVAIVLGCILALIERRFGMIQAINYSTSLLLFIHMLAIMLLVYGLARFRRYTPIVVNVCISISLMFWMLFGLPISLKYFNVKAIAKESGKITSSVFPEDFGEEPVLFLDSGNVPFYKSAPSYTRYFYNLPMQRWESGDDWPIQSAEYEKIKNYSGKYIVYSGWFKLDKYPELKEKIDNEYRKLGGTGWFSYPKGAVESPFEIEENPDAKSIHKGSSAYIMVRRTDG